MADLLTSILTQKSNNLQIQGSSSLKQMLIVIDCTLNRTNQPIKSDFMAAQWQAYFCHGSPWCAAAGGVKFLSVNDKQKD